MYISVKSNSKSYTVKLGIHSIKMDLFLLKPLPWNAVHLWVSSRYTERGGKEESKAKYAGCICTDFVY